jgi:hypothetical protein
MKRCPLCGDFDIDWCDHCGIPARETASSRLTREEEAEAEHYYAQQYEEYVKECLEEILANGGWTCVHCERVNIYDYTHCNFCLKPRSA